MSDLMQAVMVSLAAVGAGTLLFRSMYRGKQRKEGEATCPKCASGRPCADDQPSVRRS
jgi:hypothetical protein